MVLSKRMRRGAALAGVAATAGWGGWYYGTSTMRDRGRINPETTFAQVNAVKWRKVEESGSWGDDWGSMAPIKCEDNTQIQLWAPPSRARQMKRLENEEFDLLVVGGGATGAGVALDAQRRGLKVALIEGDDFGAGTSSRSTKLIHGGIRYLLLTFQSRMPNCFSDLLRNVTFNSANYSVVHNDLHERAHMIASAPYMTRPLPMMVPMYKWWEVPVLWMGGKIYDSIAGSRRMVPGSHYMSSAEARYRFPSLKATDDEGHSLKGCLVLYDGQMNDARMNMSVALTASQFGAVIANHTTVSALTKDTKGKVCGAEVEDVVSGKKFTVRAKQVVNATGPFADSVRRMADPKAQDIIVPSQGAHLILPDYLSPENMGFVRMTSDGRVLYFLPWEGSTIAGTTDHATEVTANPEASDSEVEFIMREANAVLTNPVRRESIRSTWAGLRPLVRKPGSKDTKEIARDHVVDVVDGGLITICGGKWTTYRRMAEDAVNKVLEMNKDLSAKAKPCSTLDTQLIGADREGLVCGGDFSKVIITLREHFDFSKDVATHLVSNYGTRALQIANIAKELETTRLTMHNGSEALNYRRLCSRYPMLEAEVIFACRHEYACSIVDIIARRTRLAFLDAEKASDCVPRVAELMAEELKWDRTEIDKQVKEAHRFLVTMGIKHLG